MPKSGSGSTVIGQSADDNCIVYAGEGTIENPYKFKYVKAAANFNAATITCVPVQETQVGVRIKRIRISVDGTTAVALGTTVRPVTTQYGYAAGGTGTQYTTQLGEPVELLEFFVAGALQYKDMYEWDLQEGIVLWRTSTTNWNGAWVGNVVFQFSTYASTDDAYIEIEGEWWNL